MYPTLKQNEYVFCLKQFQIERGDIVAFNNLGNNVIKRVIGLPGETIDINDDGTIIINDKAFQLLQILLEYHLQQHHQEDSLQKY